MDEYRKPKIKMKCIGKQKMNDNNDRIYTHTHTTYAHATCWHVKFIEKIDIVLLLG
mgnify:CR=1 FL=1